MHEMVFAVRDEMQVAYPELTETAERVSKVVLAEEQQFARVLELGSQELDHALADSTHSSMFSAAQPSSYSLKTTVMKTSLTPVKSGRRVST